MNYFKKIALSGLIFCSLSLYGSEYLIAKNAYSIEEASKDFLLAGYNIIGKELVIRGNPQTGANFVDVILPLIDAKTDDIIQTRAVCYGPGRYVLPHSHNEDELFYVMRGACSFWILDHASNWLHSTAKAHDVIKIPAGTIHCLLASSEGLCMHVPWDDRTRSVDFVPVIKAPFESTLK